MMMTTHFLKIFVYFLLQNSLDGLESNDMKEIQSFLDVELNRNNEKSSSKVHISNNSRTDSPNIVKRAAFEDDYYQTESHHNLPYEPFFLTTVSQYTNSNRFKNYSDDGTLYSQQQRQNNYDKDSLQSTEFCRLLVSKKADSWIRNKPGTEWVCSLSVSKDAPNTFYKDDKPFLSVNVSISGWITDNHAFSDNSDGLSSTPKYYLNVGNEPIWEYDSIFKNEPNYEVTFTIDYPIEGKLYQKQPSVPRKEYGATIPNITYHPNYRFYFSNEDDNYEPNMWLDVQPPENQGTVETSDKTQQANWINDYKQVNDMTNNVTENFPVEHYPKNSRFFLNEFGDQYGLLPTVNIDQQFNREIMTDGYTVENTPCFNFNEANLRVLFPPEDVYQYTTFQTWMNDFKPKSSKTPCGCVRQQEIYVMQNPEDAGYVFLCENHNRKKQSCNSFGKWLFFCSNNNQFEQNQPGTGFVQHCNNDERLTEELRFQLQQQQQQLQWQEEELYKQNVLLQHQYQSYMAHLQQQEMTHIQQLKQKAQLSFQQEQKLKEEMKLKEELHRTQMRNQEDKFLREFEKYQKASKEQERRLFEQLNQQQHKHQQELVKKEEELRILHHQHLQEQLNKQRQQQQNWEQQQNWQHQQDLQSYYQQQLEHQRRQQEMQLELERQQQLIYQREKQEQQIHQQNYYDTQIQKQLEYQQQQALQQMQHEYQQQTQLDYELQQQYDLRHQHQQNIFDFYYQQPYQFHQFDYNQNEDIGQQQLQYEQQKYLLQYPLFTGTGYACSKNHFPGWAATVWPGSVRPCINPLIESSSSGDSYEWNPCINQANNFFGFYNGRIEEVSQLADQLDEADRFYLNNFGDFENEYKIMWDKISDLFDKTSFK